MNGTGTFESVRIPAPGAELSGDLVIPDEPRGIVLFAHGSGSSRHSARNRYVAGVLHVSHMATLLFDLLSEEEDRRPEARFDIPLLTHRLLAARQFIADREDLVGLRVGYFGASTGAAAALRAAAFDPADVDAIVSRGGRPDLAGDTLALVQAPTLLVVGGNDPEVLALNRAALARLDCPKRLEIVAGATHLFEEPGTMARVATLACDWFVRNLAGPEGP